MEENRHVGTDPLEIERKFLIRYPEQSLLERFCEASIDITQTYLRREADGDSRRVRQSVQNGAARWHYWEKRRLSERTRVEREHEITQEKYLTLLAQADPERQTIRKRRWRVPYGGHVLEVDVFPFWTDRAFCEVELEREDEPVLLPDWIQVVREVTAEACYTNSSLARALPREPLFPDCSGAELVIKCIK